MSAALDLGDALFTIVGIVNGDCTDEVNDSEALVDKITSILDELKDIKTNWPALLERLKKNKQELIIDAANIGEDWQNKDMKGVGIQIANILNSVFFDSNLIDINELVQGIYNNENEL